MKISPLSSLVIGIMLAAISAAAQAPTPAEPATLYFENREIVTLRATRGSYTPGDRIVGAKRRLHDELRAAGRREITTLPIDGAVAVAMNTTILFTVLPDDIDPDLVGQGATTEAVAQAAAARLNAAVGAWLDQRKPSVIARGLLYSLIALALAVATMWIISRGVAALKRRLTERATTQVEGRTAAKELNLLDPVLKLLQVSVALARMVLLAAITYLWLTYAFAQFPLTAPLASKL